MIKQIIGLSVWLLLLSNPVGWIIIVVMLMADAGL